jgi:hypothetical protein
VPYRSWATTYVTQLGERCSRVWNTASALARAPKTSLVRPMKQMLLSLLATRQRLGAGDNKQAAGWCCSSSAASRMLVECYRRPCSCRLAEGGAAASLARFALAPSLPCVTVQPSPTDPMLYLHAHQYNPTEEASPNGCWPAAVAACFAWFVSSLHAAFVRVPSSLSGLGCRQACQQSVNQSARACTLLRCLCEPLCLQRIAPPRRCQGSTLDTRHTSHHQGRTCRRDTWLCARGCVIPPCPCLAHTCPFDR